MASAKRLNRLIPTTSLVDKKQSICLIGDVIYHFVTGKWIKRSAACKLVEDWTSSKSCLFVNQLFKELGFMTPSQLYNLAVDYIVLQ